MMSRSASVSGTQPEAGELELLNGSSVRRRTSLLAGDYTTAPAFSRSYFLVCPNDVSTGLDTCLYKRSYFSRIKFIVQELLRLTPPRYGMELESVAVSPFFNGHRICGRVNPQVRDS